MGLIKAIILNGLGYVAKTVFVPEFYEKLPSRGCW
jgi:hypothetical protein